MCVSWAESLASTQGRSRNLSRAIEVSVRGECSKDGWVTSGRKALLYRWFLVGLVLALASYVELSSLGRANSSVGWTIF